MSSLTPPFHPVIHLPKDYEIYDFTKDYDPNRKLSSPYGIGKYDEARVGMYETELFTKDKRNIHLGIDIGAPLGTPVYSFDEGKIFKFGYNAADGDYGYTLISEHFIFGKTMYALYGHLSKRSIENKKEGMPITRGELIAWIGDKHENGGWNPHLHFQLSFMKPDRPDLPGTASAEGREEALKLYPDPRLVLGPLY